MSAQAVFEAMPLFARDCLVELEGKATHDDYSFVDAELIEPDYEVLYDFTHNCSTLTDLGREVLALCVADYEARYADAAAAKGEHMANVLGPER